MGKKIGATLKGGEVLALIGDLGAGKTALTKGIAQALGVKTQVISPSFMLMRKYEAHKLHLYHVDLYRLESNVHEEVMHLGIFDLWNQPENVFVIEWANRLPTLPQNTIRIEITEHEDGERLITITNLHETIH